MVGPVKSLKLLGDWLELLHEELTWAVPKRWAGTSRSYRRLIPPGA